jgi:translation initiation factor 1A
MAHLRCKFRKRLWFNKDDVVLVGLRDYQDEKADIVHKYLPDEVRLLVRWGEIPSDRVVLGVDTGSGDEGEDESGAADLGGGGSSDDDDDDNNSESSDTETEDDDDGAGKASDRDRKSVLANSSSSDDDDDAQPSVTPTRELAHSKNERPQRGQASKPQRRSAAEATNSRGASSTSISRDVDGANEPPVASQACMWTKTPMADLCAMDKRSKRAGGKARRLVVVPRPKADTNIEAQVDSL